MVFETFWTPGLPKGVLSNHPCPPVYLSLCLSVSPPVCLGHAEQFCFHVYAQKLKMIMVFLGHPPPPHPLLYCDIRVHRAGSQLKHFWETKTAYLETTNLLGLNLWLQRVLTSFLIQNAKLVCYAIPLNFLKTPCSIFLHIYWLLFHGIIRRIFILIEQS